ncbi:hypothetical protein RUND412_006163 [Rhizina undulata]
MDTPSGRDDGSRAQTPIQYNERISPASSSPTLNIPTLRPRRSSLSLRLDTIRYAGGVNSLDNFARSWTRAAGYFEITPSRQSYVSVDAKGDEEVVDNNVFEDDLDEHAPLQPTMSAGSLGSYHSYSTISRYGSFGTGGMPGTRLGETTARNLGDMLVQPSVEGENLVVVPGSDKEREPLLVKAVEREDGKVEHVIVGQSTLPQTVFNSVNTLIGIGILSLPLGMKYSGWLVGMLFLLVSAIVTNYSAKLLARCLDKSGNPALVTYSDIAYIAFGQKARIIVSVLFSLELLAACVALVVLFADSLNELIPGLTIFHWKIIAGFVLTPMSFLPLRVLSFTSILGILSTLSIFSIVLINGLIKGDAPGSLRDPMDTYLFPQSWLTLPLSFGLLMAPWGGHSVFPNIYKDMRHPHKYNKAVDITYSFTYFLDAGMAVVGLLMFGDGVKDEITANILEMGGSGYPHALCVAMVVFIAIIPLTKTPLNARPIITTIEILSGVDARIISESGEVIELSAFNKMLARIFIRVTANIVFVIIAILLPSFDQIMAFMGSALCFTICIIFPLLFYLKIFGKEVPTWERNMNLVLVAISTVMAVLGTAFAFVPKEDLLGR